MKGRMLTIPPYGDETVREFDAPPELETLNEAIGGGYLEPVPGFHTLGKERCVALCDEDGKRKQLAPNTRANMLWADAMARSHATSPAPDYLVGTVIILTGDAEFMAAL